VSPLAASVSRHPLALALLMGVVAPACAAADPPPAIAPSAAEMARCAAIGSRDARLACFDALSAAQPVAIGSPGPAPTPTPAPTRVAPATPAAAPQPAPSRPEPAVVSAADAERDFGLRAVQRHDEPRGPAAIHAHIVSMTRDALGHTEAVLDNGQTWTFTNEDPRLASGAAITIKRAALGAFLVLTPSNHSFHARRIN
jgi:hypothetical protein